MTKEQFEQIDKMEIKYKYVEKDPIKKIKRLVDFSNFELYLSLFGIVITIFILNSSFQ